ncbi:hypothetical protein LIER_44016 [Lithospermum erythrorhizon]|uniref:Uncharacterized protein n=1 Tax=Lithospermum erythrorhizon TaxID=34254 RepID=A0AAV3RIX4_LITER
MPLREKGAKEQSVVCGDVRICANHWFQCYCGSYIPISGCFWALSLLVSKCSIMSIPGKIFLFLEIDTICWCDSNHEEDSVEIKRDHEGPEEEALQHV